MKEPTRGDMGACSRNSIALPHKQTKFCMGTQNIARECKRLQRNAKSIARERRLKKKSPHVPSQAP